MKTKNQILKTAAFAMLTTTMIFFTSCKKEEMTQSDNGTPTETSDNMGSRFCNSMVYSPQSHPFGYSYAKWSAKWWKWSMEFPLTGHPFIDDPSFQVSAGQSGHVWYLAAPFGTVSRNITIQHNKSLFIGLLNAEASDLEGLGTTAVDQRANAKFNADHIRNLSFSIDGQSLNNIASYRFSSPQFSFTAPTPWIFGATGGNGTSVGDGYYVMVKPLHHGSHTIHYSGDFHFAVAEGDPFDFDAPLDMTYHITVQ